DRFASADEVADLLQQCLAHVQQPDLVPLPADWQFPQAIRFSALRRRWRGIAVGAACLLTALALVAINRGLPPAGQRDGGSQGAARNPAGDLVDETGAGLLSGYDWDDCVGELLETLGQDVGDAERAFGANEDRKTDEPGSASAQDGKDQRP
ncbi:MAG: hypothetical protein ACKV0T_09280, partial [Planctomycetales bacterium]